MSPVTFFSLLCGGWWCSFSLFVLSCLGLFVFIHIMSSDVCLYSNVILDVLGRADHLKESGERKLLILLIHEYSM